MKILEMENNNSRGGLLLRSGAHSHQTGNKTAPTTSSRDFVLQWGNRKKMRCIKVKKSILSNKSESPGSVHRSERASARIGRRFVRSDQNNTDNPNNICSNSISAVANKSHGSNCNFNLREGPASPSHRILRNSDCSIAMRGQSNGIRGLASPERGGAHDRRGSSSNNGSHTNNNNRCNKNSNNNRSAGSPSSEAANDAKKGGLPPASDANTAAWPPEFAIALTNKEKEEDFMVLKGSKPPQRPKKRAKLIQRTVNLISPGAWLCDLSLERYEVREKKVCKKRPRGLKAMGIIESDSD